MVTVTVTAMAMAMDTARAVHRSSMELQNHPPLTEHQAQMVMATVTATATDTANPVHLRNTELHLLLQALRMLLHQAPTALLHQGTRLHLSHLAPMALHLPMVMVTVTDITQTEMVTIPTVTVIIPTVTVIIQMAMVTVASSQLIKFPRNTEPQAQVANRATASHRPATECQSPMETVTETEMEMDVLLSNTEPQLPMEMETETDTITQTEMDITNKLHLRDIVLHLRPHSLLHLNLMEPHQLD
jgi:hypothetical protein